MLRGGQKATMLWENILFQYPKAFHNNLIISIFHAILPKIQEFFTLIHFPLHLHNNILRICLLTRVIQTIEVLYSNQAPTMNVGVVLHDQQVGIEKKWRRERTFTSSRSRDVNKMKASLLERDNNVDLHRHHHHLKSDNEMMQLPLWTCFNFHYIFFKIMQFSFHLLQ